MPGKRVSLTETEEDKLPATGEPAVVKPAEPEVKQVAARKPPVKRVNFDVWCSARCIPAHHKKGRRAFVADVNVPRTLEDWDKVFETY